MKSKKIIQIWIKNGRLDKLEEHGFYNSGLKPIIFIKPFKEYQVDDIECFEFDIFEDLISLGFGIEFFLPKKEDIQIKKLQEIKQIHTNVKQTPRNVKQFHELKSYNLNVRLNQRQVELLNKIKSEKETKGRFIRRLIDGYNGNSSGNA